MANLISGGLQAVMGIAQASAGAAKRKQAEKLKPGLEDPEQRSLLNYLERKRNSLYSGAAVAGAKNELDTTNASIANGIVQSAGGDSGAALTGLSRLGKVSGTTFNDVLGKAEDRASKYDQFSADILDKIVNRKLQLQMYEYTSHLGQAASLIDGGVNNISAGLATAGGGTEGSTPSSATAAPADTGTINGDSKKTSEGGAGASGSMGGMAGAAMMG